MSKEVDQLIEQTAKATGLDRLRAIEALGRHLDNAHAVSRLFELLADDDIQVRYTTTATLQNRFRR